MLHKISFWSLDLSYFLEKNLSNDGALYPIFCRRLPVASRYYRTSCIGTKVIPEVVHIAARVETKVLVKQNKMMLVRSG